MPVRTYRNPVYDRDFPDPFVLRFNGRYYAYGTGYAEDGRCFPMLTSMDLLHWEPHGGALEPLRLPGTEAYWAPEVAYAEGRFYLYYATGREANPDHHLRVATASHPLGPWEDAGLNLTPHEIFAIDAHPFRDPRDGQWYLFYARDELEPPFAGTGIVVDRLAAMNRLAGTPRRVLRPWAEWQLFERKRAIKHYLDWYTVEGPFVQVVAGEYVCLYSGGRYERPNYGVGWAHAEHPLGPWTDDRNAAGPQLLRTIPGRVIGPGHNSVAVGPDLIARYLVYHAWDPSFTCRTMRIDPLEWEGAEPRCPGPTLDPQPAPPLPDLHARFDSAAPGPEWEGGGWGRAAGALAAGEGARLTLRAPVLAFTAEVSVRLPGPRSRFGLEVGERSVWLERERLVVGEAAAPLPAGFRPDAWRRLLLRRQGERLVVTLDEYPTLAAPLAEGPVRLALVGDGGAETCHFVLTRRAATD